MTTTWYLHNKVTSVSTHNTCERKYYIEKVKLILFLHSSAPHFKKYGVTTSQAVTKGDNNDDTKIFNSLPCKVASLKSEKAQLKSVVRK